jgi:hypothetical protein
MDWRKIEPQATRYILDRACPSGGFCFYRLDEPNPQDTYFALATLRLLQKEYNEERTIAYLQSLQHEDGAYASLARAYFAVSSLLLLGSSPIHDPKDAVARLIDRILTAYRRPGASPALLFHELHRLVALRAAVKLDRKEMQSDIIHGLLYEYFHEDGGFGTEGSSLIETLSAVAALRKIGRFPSHEAVAPFLRSCEHPLFGYTGKPGTSLYFLEYIHAGLALCEELSLRPTHPAACAAFLQRCQTGTGGFARTIQGIATLENTFYAINGLKVLAQNI